MAAKIVEAAILEALDDYNAAHAADWEFGLYENNFTPDVNTVLGDLTEASFPGYARQPVAAIAAAAYDNVDSRGEAVFDPITFVLSTDGGPYDMYGYFVYDTVAARLVWANIFPGAPITLALTGDGIRLNLTEIMPS